MKKNLLPQKLKELRKVHNYTQDYVAEVLGVVRQTYSHYETGKRTPDAEALYKLAGLYNISIDDLLHLTINIDRDESYDAPAPTDTSSDLSEFLDFFNDPANKKKYIFHSNLEKELLFYFDKISEEDKKEIIEFTKIKARKPLH
ncbi:MAG: helix-turn-helix domain-containing protein [Lachnospiraceae bacterium]|mgnify:CR=1 FL=1|nr:helix-turn-helix domain-containing protein [Lachnospiraceae bacterium]